MSFLRSRTLLFFSLLTALLLASCTEKQSKLAAYGPALEAVMRSDVGAFRGFDLGAKMDTVMKQEAGEPLEVDDNYLYYEFKIGDTLGTYSLSYDFDETGLNEIQSDVFVTNPDNTENVFNSFKKYFEDHYGANEDHMGFSVWTVRSEKYGNVRINLSDESSDLATPGAPGKISLWIYPDKE